MRIGVRATVREEFVDITAQVARVLAEQNVREGIVLVSSPHTTAGITVNENADPDVTRDLAAGLARLAPHDAGWRHVEGNSDAHLKTALLGTSVLLPVSAGRLVLGTWQAVYFAEFDGPRSRHVDVTVVANRG